MNRDFILEELKQLNVKSYEKLEEYVDFCIKKSDPSNFECRHHILPKSKNLPFANYSNLKEKDWNCSYLSNASHFKAHWLLLNAISHQSVSFAFFAMKNKNSKLEKITIENIDENSKEYANAMEEHRIFLSNKSSGKCVIRNIVTNDIIYDDSSLLRLNEFESVFRGRVCVLEGDKKVWINNTDYDKSKHTFHTAGKSNYYNTILHRFEFINSEERTHYHIHQNTIVGVMRDGLIKNVYVKDIILGEKIYKKKPKETIPKTKKFNFYNLSTDEIIESDKNPNPKICINTTHMRALKVFDINTYERLVLEKCDMFDKTRHLLISKNIGIFIDTVSKKFYQHNKNYKGIRATKSNIKKYIDENFQKYNIDKSKEHHNKGKVLCKDHDGNFFKVTQDEFKKRKDLFGVNRNVEK